METTLVLKYELYLVGLGLFIYCLMTLEGLAPYLWLQVKRVVLFFMKWWIILTKFPLLHLRVKWIQYKMHRLSKVKINDSEPS